MRTKVYSFLSLFLLIGILAGCNGEGDSSDETLPNGAMDLVSLRNHEAFALNEKYRGDEYMAELKEIYYCSSGQENKMEKVKLLLQSADQINSISGNYIAQIASLKEKVLKNVGSKKVLEDRARELRLTAVNIKEIPDSWSKKSPEINIYNEMFACSKSMSGILAGSNVSTNASGEVDYSSRYSFQLKKISKGSDIQKEIENQLNSSNVSIDDKEMIAETLMTLLSDLEVPSELNTIEALTYLTILERKVMSARAYSLAAIRYRVGSCVPY